MSKRKFWCAPSKDCQSECCNPPSPAPGKASVIRKTKLQKGNLVIYKEPNDKICRVENCKLYGKTVKNFLSHIESMHCISWKQHQELPPATLRQQYIATKTNSQWMKYRKPELCFVPGCRLGHKVYLTDLVKHLRKGHSLSREEYRQLLSTLSLQNFDDHCPSMIEEVEESAMEVAAKMMGTKAEMILALNEDDQTYPSVRMVKLQVQPGKHGYVSFKDWKSTNEVEVILKNNKEEGTMLFLGRKRIMSEEHGIAFIRSMSASTCWIYNLPAVDCLKYDCGICGHVHSLEIIFVSSRNMPRSV